MLYLLKICSNHHIWPRFRSDWCQDTSDLGYLRRKGATQIDEMTHSDIGRATQPIFRAHISTNVYLCMFSSSILPYIIWFGKCYGGGARHDIMLPGHQRINIITLGKLSQPSYLTEIQIRLVSGYLRFRMSEKKRRNTNRWNGIASFSGNELWERVSEAIVHH